MLARRRRRASRTVTSRARPLVITLLLLSGATGLVYELTWSKRLANLLGNTGQAHAIVLSTFMGGLALGAFLFGRRADRSKRARWRSTACWSWASGSTRWCCRACSRWRASSTCASRPG